MAEPPIHPAYCERLWQEVWQIDDSCGRPRQSHIELTGKTLDPSIVSEAARARNFGRRIQDEPESVHKAAPSPDAERGNGARGLRFSHQGSWPEERQEDRPLRRRRAHLAPLLR